MLPVNTFLDASLYDYNIDKKQCPYFAEGMPTLSYIRVIQLAHANWAIKLLQYFIDTNFYLTALLLVQLWQRIITILHFILNNVISDH